MNTITTNVEAPSCRLSEEGRTRLLSQQGEPLFLAAWERVLFLHFEVKAETLQQCVPFELDLYEGRACVSLVAFTMRGMHPRFGGRPAAWLCRPVATHHFLNVRTYIRHGNERGIYFITEWLSNWLSVQLGPYLYGLPYQHAKIVYRNRHETELLTGSVKADDPWLGFAYKAWPDEGEAFAPCPNKSLDEFLLERYTAYTSRSSTRRFFRIWHPPWPQLPVQVSINDDSLLRDAFPWFQSAEWIGANYSPGFDEVWMGRAQFVKKAEG